ncbi:hypothetical protein D4764_11G0003730 [Takifugu flavidus]|uniref:Uncharacterized protein n=1 Tax=Takifugu flavidus TaxID=433684 RepID=A0A5C6PER4_9TELE|nr:hypothetical protein D4764_11G0003730 [Takifugu flavidus]
MVAALGVSGLEKLTHRHAVKLSPPAGVSVEECVLVVGEIVGPRSVKSASRMNRTVVVFMDSTEKADQLVVAGVVIKGALTPVFPLSNPVKKVVVSNVPPFLKNELLLWELSRHERVVSQMRLIPLGSKSPLLGHVVSLRQQVSMVLNNNKEELNLALRFRVDEFDYTVYVTTDSLLLSVLVVGRRAMLSGRARMTRRLIAQSTRPTAQRCARTTRTVEMHSGYSLSKIRSFLRTTKGMRSVQVEGYFPDLQLFQESTKYFMKTGSFGQASFTDQELYRLKKLLLKIRSRPKSAD